MGRPNPAERLTPGQDGEAVEIRYIVPKLCRLCELTKPIPEQDDVCGDCWALRMAGRALVKCPFYLFEEPGVYERGMVPIELCYDCAWRSGWTEELGTICNHPIAVTIKETWGVEVVHCPLESTLAGESRWVPMKVCTGCRWHRGELVIETGRFAYCGVPYEMTVSPKEEVRQSKCGLPAKDEPSLDPEKVVARLKGGGP